MNSRHTHRQLFTEEELFACIDVMGEGASCEEALNLPVLRALSSEAKRALVAELATAEALRVRKDAISPPERLLKRILSEVSVSGSTGGSNEIFIAQNRRILGLQLPSSSTLPSPWLVVPSSLLLLFIVVAVLSSGTSLFAPRLFPDSVDGVVTMLSDEAEGDVRTSGDEGDIALLSVDATSMSTLQQAYDEQTF